MRALVVRLAALLVACVIVELGVRVASMFVSGPRVLLYGTRWHRHRGVPKELDLGVEVHLLEGNGYTKYFPHEEKWANDTRGHYRVQINDHGFRGPDFDVAKRPGRRRVLTLGASSTFGFENRDHETYPYYLQKVLDRAAGRGRFEVINFAIPHEDSDAIRSMFLAEGVALDPDVVTIYEGLNDSKRAVLEGTYGPSPDAGVGSWLLSVALARELAAAALPARSRPVLNEGVIEAARARYLRNLDVIAAQCRRNGARLIVVTQQARSLMIEPARLHGLTYDEEVRYAERALAAPPSAGSFNAMQLSIGAMLAVHARVMQGVREWASANGVPLLDGIALLDHERDLMSTWVHLSPPANKALAKALAAKVLDVLASPPGRP